MGTVFLVHVLEYTAKNQLHVTLLCASYNSTLLWYVWHVYGLKKRTKSCIGE